MPPSDLLSGDDCVGCRKRAAEYLLPELSCRTARYILCGQCFGFYSAQIALGAPVSIIVEPWPPAAAGEEDQPDDHARSAEPSGSRRR